MTNIIKLDYDIKHEYFEKYVNFDEFIKTRIAILETLGYKVKKWEFIETRRGYHLIIEIDKDLSLQRIFELQFLLGDDQNRVNYNFFRLENWGEKYAKYFNLLFTKKFKRK